MAEPYASTGRWSDLPIDLLIKVLQLLKLPEALAFHAVCPSWRSSFTAGGGTPHTRQTPCLVSLATDSPHMEKQRVSSKFRSLLDGRVKAVALCGASHGWLIAANELSDLVLYDPFATPMTTIPLPPITTFSKCIDAVYRDKGGKNVIKGYHYLFRCPSDDSVHDAASTGKYFYDKVVLSGSPSAGDTIALAVHAEGTRLSFANVGGSSCWKQISVIQTSRDSFADIVHHRGKFYALTMKGMLESVSYGGQRKPKRETIIAQGDNNSCHVITRYLVSTPWGYLLQLRVILDRDQENYVRVEIDRLDLQSRIMVGLKPTEALRGHTVFLGQNSSIVLSADEFPELRPECIYFTTPRLKNENTFRSRYNRWSGVKVYDLKTQKLEAAFPSSGGYYRPVHPLELWFHGPYN